MDKKSNKYRRLIFIIHIVIDALDLSKSLGHLQRSGLKLKFKQLLCTPNFSTNFKDANQLQRPHPYKLNCHFGIFGLTWNKPTF